MYSSHGLVLQDLSALRLGMLQIHGGRFAAADSIHRSIIARYQGRRGAETLVGQAQWQLAISEGRQNRIGNAIRAFNAAATALATAGDSSAFGAVRAELVEGYELVGQYSAALRSGLAGLSGTSGDMRDVLTARALGESAASLATGRHSADLAREPVEEDVVCE